MEICTSDAACAQQCTIICECTALRRLFQDTDRVKHTWLSSPLDAFLCTASNGDRQKREASKGSNSVELVSVGPLLLGHDPQLEDTACVTLNASKSQQGIRIQTGFSCFSHQQAFLFQCFGWWWPCFLPSGPSAFPSWCSQPGQTSGRSHDRVPD